MNEEREVFVDGIGEIGLVGGVVRIDLVSLSTQSLDGEGKPRMVFRQRLVVPPEGFLRMFSHMQGLLDKLEAAGIVKKADGGGAAVQPPASPNFG